MVTASVNIYTFSEIGRLKDENILVLPLDIVNFDEHIAAVNQVLSQFKQVGTCNVILKMTILRTRLHLASASKLRGLCGDASGTFLIENNGVD